VLTKPLGTGVLATALKAGAIPAEGMDEAAASMSTLNDKAAAAAQEAGVRAATDITGFGLVGHALQVARESRLTLEIRVRDLPLLKGALAQAERHPSGGLKANRRQFERRVGGRGGLEPALDALLFDPQTSGGLLLLVDEAAVSGVLRAVPSARTVGRTLEPGPLPIHLV
jgi:selenide,water dikinase